MKETKKDKTKDKNKEKITMKSPEGERDKKIALIVASIVAVIALIVFVWYFAFGGKYNGEYELTAVTVMDMTVPSENFDEVFGSQGYLTMTIKGEKCTFEGNLIDSLTSDEHKIIIDGENITIDLAQGADFTGIYEAKDKMIIIDMGGMYLVFEK